MATRILSTNTIANIAGFGAIPDDASLAAIQANAQAFRDALHSSARRIAIPAGVWHFQEIMYEGHSWLPEGVEIFGQGRDGKTTLVYHPTDLTVPAFSFAPSSHDLRAQSTIRDLRLYGPVTNKCNQPPQGIGISLDQALFCHVRDVAVWYFDVGIMFNSGVRPYSGHNYVERFEVNSCRTGVFVGDHTNACVLANGRVFYAVVLYDASHPKGAREEGVGIDISGTTGPIGPQGGQGLVISGVSIENSPLCLRVATSMGVSVQGCYLEPGNLVQGSVRRRSVHVDEATMGLTFEGTLFSEPDVPTGEWNWTPTYVEVPPETRGVIDVPQAPQSGNAYAVNAYGGAISGTTTAKANLLKNADMSRGAMFWSSSVPGPLITPYQRPFVTGGASTLLTAGVTTTEHILQDFVIDSGVRTVTVGVRYQLLDPGVNAFRIDLYHPASGTRLGFFADTGPGPTPWRVRSLTGRFDGLAGGVVGPRRLRVRVYPYNGNPVRLNGQRVLIDAIWLVEGEYAASYRAYTDGIELLRGDDREEFFAGTTNVPVGPVAVGPTYVPSNAIGMTVEMQVQGSLATVTPTILRVDDLTGPSRDVHALVNQRPTLIDYTLPYAQGTPPQWSVLGADAVNTVQYSVRLKAWILRL